MLSWLCVLAKPLGTHAKASLPCSPLPLHQSLLFPLIFAKEHLSLALLAPPVTPSLSIPTTFSKAHQPLRPAPRPCLPSKKVRCCHPKKFGRLPEGLLPIRTINEIFRSIPSTKLASLVKGEVLSPEFFRATTGGIALHPPTFSSPQPLQKNNNPSLSTTSLPPLEKGEVLSPEKILATTEGIAPYPHQSLLFPLIFAKEHLSLALLAPPVAPNTAIPTTAKSQPPLAPHHVLALLAPVAPNTANFASIFLIQYTNYS